MAKQQKKKSGKLMYYLIGGVIVLIAFLFVAKSAGWIGKGKELEVEMAKAKRPADWTVVGTPQSFEAYGCMLRKDDPAFKKVVDGALTKVMTSGEAEKIYAKWFLQPIPPKGLNLNFPLSEPMKKLYKAPNDKAFE